MNPRVVRIAAVFLLLAGTGVAILVWRRSKEFTRNESEAYWFCKTYAEAQNIFRRTDWDGDGVLEYATAAFGDHSLLERNAGKGDLTLIDMRAATAFNHPNPQYPRPLFLARILTAQGPNAPDGAKDYIKDGNMTGGYALVVWPIHYGTHNRFTFVVSNSGTVYYKELGPNTDALVSEITVYDPDTSWKCELP